MARKDMIAAALAGVVKHGELPAGIDPLGGTVAAAIDRLYLTFERATGTWAVLPAGHAFLASVAAAKEAGRKARNAAARERAAMMSGLGMRRTRAGSWE